MPVSNTQTKQFRIADFAPMCNELLASTAKLHCVWWGYGWGCQSV